jgi:hypothetical protein
MRTAAKNRDNSKIGKYERTEEIRNKLSLSKKGKPGANKGKKIENTENMKKPKDPAKLLANKKSCIWCGKFVDPGNFKQFHGDNCKMKESNNG